MIKKLTRIGTPKRSAARERTAIIAAPSTGVQSGGPDSRRISTATSVSRHPGVAPPTPAAQAAESAAPT
ncbi:MAG TPA: hypothetical protein VII75_06330, partial [Thermoanaerobaculia bacterium]